MTIKRYTPYFHDGQVRQIEHKKSNIVLVMESAQLLPEWNEDQIALSSRETISGKLHILDIRHIIEDKLITLSHFKIKEGYDNSSIYTFEIELNKVFLSLCWIKYFPDYERSATFDYQIEAEKIYWENIPELSDQYWKKLVKNLVGNNNRCS